MFTRRALLRHLGPGLAAPGALSAYAFGLEPVLRLNITRHALTPPGWTPGLKLRIVVLADMHACDPWMSAGRITRLCGHANTLGGDIIVLLGDYMTGMKLVLRQTPPAEWAALLAALRAPLGVHAIMGNHDWWEDKAAQQAGGGETISHHALRAAGIPVHANHAIRLEKPGMGFWLAGLEDQMALLPGARWGRARRRGLDDLPATLAQVTDDAPVVLLAHEPDVFPSVPSRVSLTLAGHTHGGQIRVAGYSPMVPSRYGNRYAYRHMVEEGRDLIGSGGLGCSILPVRFGCAPEIVVVDVG